MPRIRPNEVRQAQNFTRDVSHTDALDHQMNVLIVQITMASSEGTTTNYGGSGHGAPSSKPPSGNSRPATDGLVADYKRALSDQGREAVIAHARKELASLRPSPRTIVAEMSVVDLVIQDGEGYDSELVGQRYGLAPAHVRRIRQRAGRSAIDGKEHEDPKTNVKREERVREAHRMRDELHLTTRQIASLLKCSKTQVLKDLAA